MRTPARKQLAAVAIAFLFIATLPGCAVWERTVDFPGGSSRPASSEKSSSPAVSKRETPITPAPPSGIPPENPPEQPSQPTESSTESPVELPPLSMQVDYPSLSAFSPKAVTWGPGLWFDENNRPTACLELQEEYASFNAHFIGPDEPVVMLTFDLGYENGFTPAILDVLAQKQVRAVFFLTGHYLRSQPDLVRRIIDEGHILGNHTNHHLNFTAVSPEEAFEDAAWVQTALREQFDYEIRLLRLPEGAFSEQVLEMTRQMGYDTVFWSFGYNDWDPSNQMSEQEALEKLVARLHPGAIVLLHVVGETNSLILDRLIDSIHEKGYEASPLSIFSGF
jgi:peptidoglycan-N-acetylmuramic acid deacetylase